MKNISKPSINTARFTTDIRQAEYEQRRKEYLEHLHDLGIVFNKHPKNNREQAKR
jgi:hypothetical protein